jgi:hypothetical protein
MFVKLPVWHQTGRKAKPDIVIISVFHDIILSVEATVRLRMFDVQFV